MSRLIAYPQYEDSGVEWIGKIPQGWSILKLSRVISVSSGTSVSNNRMSSIKTNKLNYPAIGGNGVMGYTDSINVIENTISIGRVGALCGNTHYIDYECWITDNSLFITTYNKEKIDLKYLSNLLRVLKLNDYSTSTAQPLITSGTVKKREVPLPPLETQFNIAGFIDKKTSQIDILISDKERLIELLEEKRQAVITETVTKGLDPNVKMKDSGIEWIGEIPEHWETTKIKYTTYVKGRIGWQGLRSDEFIDIGPHLVTGTDFENGLVNWLNCYRISNERFEEAPQIQLKNDDVLITKDGTIGKIAIVKDKPSKAILNSGVFVTRPLSGEYLPEYIYWLLNSNVFTNYIDVMSSGTTVRHLYQETFNNFTYPLPDLREQKVLSESILKRTTSLNSLIHDINLQISKLKEYRESLIYEAVTGKIDVRDYITETEEVH